MFLLDINIFIVLVLSFEKIKLHTFVFVGGFK